MLLKVFFSRQVGSQVTRAHLTKAKVEAEKYLRVLDQFNSQLKNKFPDESDKFFYEAVVRA